MAARSATNRPEGARRRRKNGAPRATYACLLRGPSNSSINSVELRGFLTRHRPLLHGGIGERRVAPRNQAKRRPALRRPAPPIPTRPAWPGAQPGPPSGSASCPWPLACLWASGMAANLIDREIQISRRLIVWAWVVPWAPCAAGNRALAQPALAAPARLERRAHPREGQDRQGRQGPVGGRHIAVSQALAGHARREKPAPPPLRCKYRHTVREVTGKTRASFQRASFLGVYVSKKCRFTQPHRD